MIHLTKGLLSLFFTCCLFAASAQQPPINEPDYNKPKLFQDFPEKSQAPVRDMEKMFEAAEGQTINIPLKGMPSLNGHIVSRSNNADPRVLSIVLKLTNRKGANFTFTRITNADGSTEYLGRILSREHGDCLELVQENGQYVFKKIALYDLVQE